MRRLLSIFAVMSLLVSSSYTQVVEELRDKILEETIYVDPNMETDNTDVTLYLLCGSGSPANCAWYESDKKTFLKPPAGFSSYPIQASNTANNGKDGVTKYTISVPRKFDDGIVYYGSWTKYAKETNKIEFWKRFVIRHASSFQFKDEKNIHNMQAPVSSEVRLAPNDVYIENYYVKEDAGSSELTQANKFVFLKKEKGKDVFYNANYGNNDNLDYAALMAYQYTTPSDVGSKDTFECWVYRDSKPLCKVETYYVEYKDKSVVGPSADGILKDKTLRNLYRETFEEYEIKAGQSYCDYGLQRDPVSGNWICLAGLYDGTKSRLTTDLTQQVPSRGEYAIVKSGVSIYDSKQEAKDGNQLLYVDAGNTITKFYEKVQTDMCAGVTLQFSAWLYSSARPGVTSNFPSLKFVIRNADTEEELASFVTGNITSRISYSQYGFSFKVPDNTPNLKFEIWNNTIVATGNDFAIDDIEISLIEEELGTIINYSQDQVVAVCSDLNVISFSGTLENSPYNRTYYQWQVCSGGSLSDTEWKSFSPISERPQYNIRPASDASSSDFVSDEDGAPQVITGYYRLIAGDYRSISQNLMQCVQVSKYNKVTLQNVILSLESEYGKQNVCNEGNNGSIEVLISGGDFPYTFSFSGRSDTLITEDASCVNDSVVNFVFDKLDAGKYSLTVSDLNHCVASDNYEITQDEDISQKLTINEKPTFGMSDGQFTISQVKKGSELIPYSYEIRRNGVVMSFGVSKNQSESSVISGMPGGSYEVEIWSTGSLDRGCSSVISFLLPEVLDYQIEIVDSTKATIEEGESISVELRLCKIDGSTITSCANGTGKKIFVGVSFHDISTSGMADYEIEDGLVYVLNDSVVDGVAIPKNTYYATISDGGETAAFTVKCLTDNAIEPDESFILMTTTVLNAQAIKTATATTGTDGVKIGIGSPFSKRMTIRDVHSDMLYVLFEPETGYGYEAKNITKNAAGQWVSAPPIEDGWFEVSLRDASYNPVLAGEALDVYYHVDPKSTATHNLDYRLLNNSIVSIPKGASKERAYIHVLEDNLIEGDETLIVVLDSVRTKMRSSAKLGIPVGKSKSEMSSVMANLPDNYTEQAVVTILDDEIITLTDTVFVNIRPQQAKVNESDDDTARNVGLYLTVVNQSHMLDRDIVVNINMEGTAVCGDSSSIADSGDFYYAYIDTTGKTTKYTTYKTDTRQIDVRKSKFPVLFPGGVSDSPLFYIIVNNDRWLEYRETEYVRLTPSIGNNDKIVFYTDYTDPTNGFVKKSKNIAVKVKGSSVIEIIDDEIDYLKKLPIREVCSGVSFLISIEELKDGMRSHIANIDNYDMSLVYYPREEYSTVLYGAHSCYEGCLGFFQNLTLDKGVADVYFDGYATLIGKPGTPADHTSANQNDTDERLLMLGLYKLEKITARGVHRLRVTSKPMIRLGENRYK